MRSSKNVKNMRKEFGKWLMDIAKYIATAVILSSVFGEVEPLLLYIGDTIAVLSTLTVGLFLVSDRPLNRNRNNNPQTD